MDVHLTREAQQHLKAIHIVSPKTHGLLIGHKRGHRFVVERILPTPKSFTFPLEKHMQLNQILEDSIIGFFSFDTDKSLLSRILVPFFTRKLFLEISQGKGNKTTINPFVIEYDKKFHLSPIKIKSFL